MTRTVSKEQATEVLQRARMRAAALALQEGRVVIPLRCEHCRGTGLYEDPMAEPFAEAVDDEGRRSDRRNAHRLLVCVSCGRRTMYLTAHKLRRQEISEFIREGIDIDLPSRRNSGKRYARRMR